MTLGEADVSCKFVMRRIHKRHDKRTATAIALYFFQFESAFTCNLASPLLAAAKALAGNPVAS
jgi:hypothetical protein